MATARCCGRCEPPSSRDGSIDRRRPKRNAASLLEEVLPVFKQMRVHELFPAAGQSAGMIDEVLPAGEIVRRLVTEARTALERSSGLLT